ncbi:uncharacterized protein LOC110674765 isoform X2 [Aedes aegypti]|uniref:DDE-1 domain-containing protein n=1 Tax=Aedes aegypti TaxID=7159 RepID=A0A6I8U7Z7_AEDAE|nr:uncharacterized protein LOC110674765 isoform X2 [Aedes aegypti]
MARAGFPVCQIDVTHTVKDYADKIRRRNDREIPNSFPSKNWSQRFIARHPEIRQKLVNNLSKAGAKVTEPQLRNWFFEVEELLRQDGIDTSIFDNPERILNFDESGFQLVPKRYKALCSDAENTYLVTSNSEKDCYTALFGSTAAGDLTPPMILYPGKRISRDMVENVPDGWSIGVSDEGWQTSKTFYEYIANDLYQWLQKRGTEFPVLIFVDGHKSHVNMELVEFCIQKGLILVSLYPNSTRILQPLDRNFFGPLKQIWSKVLRQNLLKNSNARINKGNFGIMLHTAVQNFTNSKEGLKKAFQLCGLFPWNVDAIDFSTLPANADVSQQSNDTIVTEEPQHDYALQLQYVEMGLNENQLLQFAENRNKDYWYGPYEQLALFNFWKTIKDKSEGLMFTTPLEQYTLITCHFTLDEPVESVPMSSEAATENNASMCPESQPSSSDSMQLNENDHGLDANKACNDDPFADVLIWPKITHVSGAAPKRKIEHIPSVATSSKWLEWHDKKDDDRKKKEEAKLARMEKRRLLNEQKLQKKSAESEKKGSKSAPRGSRKKKGQ